MMQKPGGSTSVWMDTADVGEHPPLNADLQVDVCVVGGGIAGLSTACFLAAEGRRVALVEARQLGCGETGRTTAHFFPPDERYYEIERRFGKKGAALVADAYAAATERVQRVVNDEHIDCEWERLPGYLFAPSSAGWSGIEKEYRAARRAGVPVQLLERVPGLSFDTGPALQFFNQAQFHPLKYLRGLAQTLQQRGGSLYCGTRVTGIARAGDERIVQCEAGQLPRQVRCQAVVVATNTPFHERFTMHTKQAAYRTYVLGLKLPKGSMPHMLLWDTGEPYYYIRLETHGDEAQDTLIVGGVDHKVGTDEHPQHRYEEIQRWVSTRFPQCTEVAWRWSGEVMEPVDGLPFLGRDPNDRQIFMITGDSGNGMTHCTAGAMLVTDLIQGRPNPWAELYDPARKVQNGLGRFVREQADVLVRFTDRLRGGEVEDSAEIGPGEGAVLRSGGERLAAYRDEDGGLHVLSATCTHLGCSVAWNAAEKSWDCPCHGSRFDVEGQVLHGPAKSALPARELEMPLPGAMPPSGRRPGRRL